MPSREGAKVATSKDWRKIERERARLLEERARVRAALEPYFRGER